MEQETKICPYCGEEILLVAKKCKYCGEWLTDEEEQEQRPTMECPVCGEEIDRDETVCPYCHESIDGESEEDYEEEEPEKAEEPEPMPARQHQEQAPKTVEAVYAGEEEEDGERPGWFEYYFVDPFFRNAFNFSGVISRRQYWCGMVWFMGVYLMALYSLGWAAFFIPDILEVETGGSIFVMLIWMMVALLFLPITHLAATVRRMRDTGRDPLWILTLALPIAGIVLYFIFLSEKGSAKCRQARSKPIDIIAIIAIMVLTALGMAGAISTSN